MSTKTPITEKDIRVGDLIRVEHRGESASEFRVKYEGLSGYSGEHFLLDRPKKVKYAKGTELWLTTRYFPWLEGDRIVLREDWHEGEDEGKVVYPGKDYVISEYAVTDVKPRVLKWAKGTRLWFKDDANNRAGGYTGEYTTTSDTYEDNHYVDSTFYTSRFTDEKPEPHPVGAIRWVTEDCKSRWGAPLPKGQRLVVERNHHDNTPAGDVLVTGFEEKRIFVAAKFLSETLVEPAPTLVAVPLPAIEKLRDEHQRARSGSHPNALDRSVIRSSAIRDFLDTRAVKTALREDDSW